MTRIVHRQGKHVSFAHPIVDLTLPGKHRLAISFRKRNNPTITRFTIRKFKEDPLTIVDLIINETIDESIAAYLWMLMENKMSVMIVGPTGAGKTTALNAIACLVRPELKMISVEEVQEINLPQENWVSTVARTGFGGDSEGKVTLYDLIKSAVRHRPALILVGATANHGCRGFVPSSYRSHVCVVIKPYGGRSARSRSTSTRRQPDRRAPAAAPRGDARRCGSRRTVAGRRCRPAGTGERLPGPLVAIPQERDRQSPKPTSADPSADARAGAPEPTSTSNSAFVSTPGLKTLM